MELQRRVEGIQFLGVSGFDSGGWQLLSFESLLLIPQPEINAFRKTEPQTLGTQPKRDPSSSDELLIGATWSAGRGGTKSKSASED